MILKRVEKDGEIKALYESATVLASKYNPSTKDLTIIFNNGGQYVYKAVEVTTYTRFEIADSQGKELNSNIKKHTFEKLEGVDTTKIVTEIESLRKAEKLAKIEHLQKAIKAAMETVISGNFTETALDKVNTLIVEYKNLTAPVPENA